MGLHRCTESECPFVWQATNKGCNCHQTDEQVLRGTVKDLLEVLKEGRRAIGDHNAPDDCYATGPLTGGAYRDLVQCPACSFIAMHDAALSKASS